MSSSPKKRRTRKLLLVIVIVGVVIAVRNAVADKGGSYDPGEVPVP